MIPFCFEFSMRRDASVGRIRTHDDRYALISILYEFIIMDAFKGTLSNAILCLPKSKSSLC